MPALIRPASAGITSRKTTSLSTYGQSGHQTSHRLEHLWDFLVGV